MRFFLILLITLLAAQSGSKERKDQMDRVFIYPQRVVWISSESVVTDSDVLLEVGNGQVPSPSGRRCRMQNRGSDKASIILDYGKELHGGLKLCMRWGRRAPSLVRIRFGESVEETCSEPVDTAWLMGHSTNDHAMRDYVIKIPRDGSIEIGNTGFRFVRIDVLEPNGIVALQEATAILRYRDIPYLGSFKCNDERLNQIWQTGAYTVHLNMQEYLWDGIKRDRLIWLGDMHPEVSTIMAVFGDNEVVPASIDLAREQYPLPGWFNQMSAYSMWYLIIQYEWYMHSGQKDYLESHRDYITGLVDQIDSLVDADGREHLSDRRFLDWPSSPNKEGVEAGYRALLCWAMRDAEKLCSILGEDASAGKCRSISERLHRLVKPHCGLKQAAALMAISDLMTPEDACREVVAVGGPKGFSTFYGYYMLEALAKAGMYQEALDIIRDYWGAMIDYGATTFWEDFDLDWIKNAGRIDELTPKGKNDLHGDFGAYCYPSYRHSLCHGWSSGPTPWMSRHILGIEVVEPGCRVLRVSPHLGDLDWAEGSYPTPKGVVFVRHERRPDGLIRTKVKAPRGIRVTIAS